MIGEGVFVNAPSFSFFVWDKHNCEAMQIKEFLYLFCLCNDGAVMHELYVKF